MHGPWNREWAHAMHGRRRDPWGEFGAAAWGEWWRGPAPRAERGVMRWVVLDSIGAQARHGYEIIQSIEERSGGGYRPSPGVIYPTLQMLEELGHARVVNRGDRKTYEITDEGRVELAKHLDEVRDFYGGYADASWENHADDVAHVMKRLGRVVVLFKKAMHRGMLRPSTMRRASGILDEALAKLENLFLPEDL